MKICRICQRSISSYYKTQTNRIFCYDCWKVERERVLRYRDEAMKKHQQELQQYRILEDRISELERKISSEEHKREELQNQYYLNQLKEDLNHTRKDKWRIGNVGPKFPQIDYDIMTAKYFESEAAEYRFLEEKRKAEELKKEQERKRAEEVRKAEKARQLQIQKEKEAALLKEKKRIIYENEQAVINGLSYYNGRRLNINDYMMLAYNSMNERALKKLLQSRDIQILEALLKNPTVSQEMQQEIMRRETRIKQEAERREKEKRMEIERKKTQVKKKEKAKGGCLSVIMIILVSSFIITISSCFF